MIVGFFLAHPADQTRRALPYVLAAAPFALAAGSGTLSGASVNPARQLGPALWSGDHAFQSRIGLANGWLYQAAEKDPASFFDVTQGTNRIQPVNCCTAVPGYDPASGLGVPNWAVLPGTLPPPGH